MLTRRRFVSGLGLTAAVLPLDATRAQSISRPARIVVGFPPGGGVDYVARLLVDPLKSFSPAVTVENRAGAGGRIALEATKLAPADGTMMVLTPGDQLALFPHVYKSLAYDPLRDFQPVTTVCTVPFLLTIGPMVPKEVDTPESFIAWCRANPKHSSYATPGAGTRPHFIGTALAKAAGIEFTHVPYQGAQPAIADLLGGHIAASIFTMSTTVSHILAGKLRALLTTAPVRSAMLPDTPTAGEAKLASLEGVEWFGLFMPPRTPPELVTALNESARRALTHETVKEGLAKFSLNPAGSTPGELEAQIKADFERWAEVVKTTGFEPLD